MQYFISPAARSAINAITTALHTRDNDVDLTIRTITAMSPTVLTDKERFIVAEIVWDLMHAYPDRGDGLWATVPMEQSVDDAFRRGIRDDVWIAIVMSRPRFWHIRRVIVDVDPRDVAQVIANGAAVRDAHINYKAVAIIAITALIAALITALMMLNNEKKRNRPRRYIM